MSPPPLSRIEPIAAWVQYRRPSTFTSTIRRHSSVSAPSTGPSSITPALLISACETAELGMRALDEGARLSSSPTSTSIASALPPSSSMRSASASIRSLRRAPRATAAPAPDERERRGLSDSGRGTGDCGDTAVERSGHCGHDPTAPAEVRGDAAFALGSHGAGRLWMRILMTTRGSSGHLLPLAPIAHACIAAGHEVRVAAQRQHRANLDRERLPFTACW